MCVWETVWGLAQSSHWSVWMGDGMSVSLSVSYVLKQESKGDTGGCPSVALTSTGKHQTALMWEIYIWRHILIVRVAILCELNVARAKLTHIRPDCFNWVAQLMVDYVYKLHTFSLYLCAIIWCWSCLKSFPSLPGRHLPRGKSAVRHFTSQKESRTELWKILLFTVSGPQCSVPMGTKHSIQAGGAGATTYLPTNVG